MHVKLALVCDCLIAVAAASVAAATTSSGIGTASSVIVVTCHKRRGKRICKKNILKNIDVEMPEKQADASSRGTW
jgi:hypothetical protein